MLSEENQAGQPETAVAIWQQLTAFVTSMKHV
jgi:hypothetical protein